jgi:3-hydroxyacyl-CoA dehydrogenase
MPIRCGECPGFVVNRILDLDGQRDLALPGRDGVDVEEIDQAIAEPSSRRWARSGSPT